MNAHHKDGNKLNCQRSNMRLATQSQSMQNHVRRVGFRGVFYSRHCKLWRAQVRRNGKKNHIGYYATADEAAAAAAEWRRKNPPFSRDARFANTSTFPEGSRHG